ncbi:methyl-accepting chemotaxis protein [Rhizobium sp. G21]|uniref:methyl-accepting chemotaxis protein n=1 Tax=Rhizobium sp. G21 TaxID=2758439 RepID=UPI00160482FB|nr:methyl-accepting chemotaxis protein [Rhizobium sp. G21]MBB1251417.1 hypothetical protein [Rhizobium sp. G21]
MRVSRFTRPQVLLAFPLGGVIGAACLNSATPRIAMTMAGACLVLAGLLCGFIVGRRHPVVIIRRSEASDDFRAAVETGAVAEPGEKDADIEAINDNVIPFPAKPQPSQESSRGDLALAATRLDDYPAYVDLLRMQLQSVTNVSQDAAENLLASLLEVDGRVTALMDFLKSAGSNDSSERILGQIEEQLLGCRQHLAKLGDQQEKSASDAVAFQQRLSDETQNVLTVLNGVQRIARQTTMLSLNVSIEAARVGEVGKGFSVIAQEIRSLAGEVQHLADNVHDRVSGLMSSVNTDLEDQSKRRQDSETAAMNNISDALGLLTTNLMLLLQHQREVLVRVKTENEDIAEPIMAMMGSIQFQDIVRQQIEQVISMATEVKSHIGSVRDGLLEPSRLKGLAALAETLDRLSSSYVMREQRQIHNTVLSDNSVDEAPVAMIELF